MFTNCAPFTDCMSEINNIQIGNAKYIDVFSPMYNLIEYSDNCSKTSGSLWHYYRDEPALTVAGAIANFHEANNCVWFKFKQKITVKTADGGTKESEITDPLKYVSNFWRTLEMPLITCEINLILTWFDKCVLSNDAKPRTFTITDTKPYVPVLTISSQENAKLWQQFKLGLKRTINWNKYEVKVSTEVPNPYLDFLINPCFQRVNEAFCFIV